MKNKLSSNGINLVIIGTSCFDGMASSTRVRNLMRPLVDSKTVRVSNLVYKKDTLLKENERGCLNGISYRVIGYRMSNIFTVLNFFFQGAKFICRQQSRTQKNLIYHYSDLDIQSFPFVIFAKLIGYKIVFDIIEDSTTFTKFPNIWGRIRNGSSIWFSKLLPFFASYIVVITQHLYKKMEGLRSSVPLRLLPISVDFHYFPETPTSINPNALTIFYGGSYSERDGLKFLIEAFALICQKNDHIRLVLTGKGMQHDMDRINALIDSSKVKDRIILLGFLETDEYYRYLNSADIFCMTRIDSQIAKAGFPFKLGEFLATGKAVIATNVGDVPHYLTNRKDALLIEPGSVDSVYNGLAILIENPEMIETIGREGRRTAMTHFDSEKVSRDLLQVLQTA